MTTEKQSFEQYGLDDALVRAVAELGFTKPTPIQHDAIPVLMKGHDVVGGARTGSGKTAAFGLPLLHLVREGGPVRALVLAPTRELAMQVSEALKSFSKQLRLQVLTIYGGTPYPPQIKGLKRGATVVVGTPGRVIDLMNRGALDISKVECFVLDEADEMLRMGFIDDVERVLSELPADRQIALFSATMPPPIRKVAQKYLRDPVSIQVEEKALSVSHITQSFIHVSQRDKDRALLRLMAGKPPGASLVFARTRARCAEVAQFLINSGISADALHGDLNQGARERVLGRLRSKALDIVVATDVAARGIDVDHLTHVINYDIPDDAELYVHRIGRTARAGRSGTAITLITPRERGRAKGFERKLGIHIPQGKLPSNQQIVASRRTEIAERIHRELSKPDLVEVRDWMSTLIEERGWTAEDVAAAATRMLIEELNFKFDATAVPTTTTTTTNFDSINEVEVTMSIGRRDGVRPGDIVGALANEAGIPGKQIGKVSLAAHRVFVGLPADVAKNLVENHPKFEIRGKTVHVRLNEKKSQGEDRGRKAKKGITTHASNRPAKRSLGNRDAKAPAEREERPAPQRKPASAPANAAAAVSAKPPAPAKPTAPVEKAPAAQPPVKATTPAAKSPAKATTPVKSPAKPKAPVEKSPAKATPVKSPAKPKAPVKSPPKATTPVEKSPAKPKAPVEKHPVKAKVDAEKAAATPTTATEATGSTEGKAKERKPLAVPTVYTTRRPRKDKKSKKGDRNKGAPGRHKKKKPKS